MSLCPDVFRFKVFSSSPPIPFERDLFEVFPNANHSPRQLFKNAGKMYILSAPPVAQPLKRLHLTQRTFEKRISHLSNSIIFNMGYFRHRHSCAGNCSGRCRVDTRRNRHETDAAQAKLPVNLQSVSPPPLNFSATDRPESYIRRRPFSSQQQTPHHRSESRYRNPRQELPRCSPEPPRHVLSSSDHHTDLPSSRDSRHPRRQEFPDSNVPDPRSLPDSHRDPRGSRSSGPRHSGTSSNYNVFPGVSGGSVPLRASPREKQHSHSSLVPFHQSTRQSNRHFAPGLGEYLSTYPAHYVHGEIQMVGAQWQRWIEDPNAPGCRVTLRRFPFDLLDLVNRTDARSRWKAIRNSFCDPPDMLTLELNSLGLPTRDNQYRTLLLQGPPTQLGEERNIYTHCTSQGVIIVQDITRNNGPHWNEIAAGQCEMDYRIESLRHIYFTDVMNRNVLEFVLERLYHPILRVPWTEWNPIGDMPRNWEYGTPEYQGMMGTTFGKAVAALLISVFPGGSFKLPESPLGRTTIFMCDLILRALRMRKAHNSRAIDLAMKIEDGLNSYLDCQGIIYPPPPKR
ncbi:unnamed protein product [Penicillium olsonii]|nr:unnamed protein product [Penicillium olsonii]